MLLTAAAVFPVLRASAQPTSPTTAPSTQAAMQTLDQLVGVLYGSSSRQEDRDEAARRLVARRTPEARKAISDGFVLYASQNLAQQAVLKALAEDLQPDPQLIPQLMSALNGPVPMPSLAVKALINYRDQPDVLNALIVRIVNRPANAPEPAVRREIIRALGNFVERRAANALIDVIDPAKAESAQNREAAFDALAEMASLSGYGYDSARWMEWWRAQPVGESEFRADMLSRRSARLDTVRRERDELYTLLSTALRQNYQIAPANQKLPRLMEYLRSSRAEIRAIGATLVYEDFQNSAPIHPEARAQLRFLIGDSNVRVRRAVAQALAQIPEGDSLDPLLAQLDIESDGGVRVELIKAVAPIRSARAVPVLLQLLSDPNPGIALQTAAALEFVASPLRQENPALATQVAHALRDKLKATPTLPVNADLREALVDAMVPLKEPTLLDDPLANMLKEQANESPRMRRRAIKAIGEIGNPRYLPHIHLAMEDKESQVRLEAVAALGKLAPSIENINPLKKRLDPSQEPDESIRTAAWAVIEKSLRSFPKETIQAQADDVQFRNDHPRKIAILKALAAKLEEQNLSDDLADTRINIADALLDNPAQPGVLEPAAAIEAITYLEPALAYKRGQPNASQVSIATMMRNLMRALLRSGRYDRAIQFAGEAIRNDPTQQGVMGPAIRAEAEYLRSGGKVEDALRLVEETRKMNPGLDDLQWLNEFERWANEQRNLRGVTPESPININIPQDVRRTPATRPGRTATARD